jgi:hypothetical protein
MNNTSRITTEMRANIMLLLAGIMFASTSIFAQRDRHHYPPPVQFDKNKITQTNPKQFYAISDDTSSGVVWGPVIKLSPDDPWPSGGNYTPHFAVQGDTIHCVWESGQYRLPYIRSTDDGLTWEQPRGLLNDTTPFISMGGSQFTSNNNNLYVFFSAQDSSMTGGNGRVYYINSSDRGNTWSVFKCANSDTSGAFWSPSVRRDTMALVYVPHINDVTQYPRITRSTDAGISWTKNPFDMPSSSSNQLRVALTPGLLNFFHPGDRWPGPAPEIVLHRSTDLADTWKDSLVISPIDGNGSDMPEVASFERLRTEDAAEKTTLGVMWRGEEFTGTMFSAGMALRLSYDNGKTWEPTTIVSDTPRGSFHSLAIHDNVIAVTWSDELGDWGPFRVKARVSVDCGATWKAVSNLTPVADNAGEPSVAISTSAVHVAWEEYIDNKWNVYYQRGEFIRFSPLISESVLDFDTLSVGCSSWRQVTVTNNRCDPLYLSIQMTDDHNFIMTPDSAIVPSRCSVVLNIRFAPLSTGDKSDQLLLIHNQSAKPDTIFVSAFASGTGSETFISDSLGIEWQLVSLPLDPHCPYVLPASFFYQGSYCYTDTLQVGRGYWNKFTKPKITFAGTTIIEDTIPVTARWNIVGSISSPIEAHAVQSNPPGLVTSNFYGYDGTNYFIADTLYPGRGYWVKVNEDAEMILSASSSINHLNCLKITAIEELPPPPPESETSEPYRPGQKQLPVKFALQQNYPNPFNPTTTIRFTLQDAGYTTLKVYDIFGRDVATLVNEKLDAGEHEVKWNPSTSSGQMLSSGVYFYRLQTQPFTETKKLLILR